MNLSRRRFRHVITRRRQEAGRRNTFGEWVSGETTERTFRASIQPLSLEEMDLVGGGQLSERRAAYIPVPDALRAAYDDRQADRVVFDGDEFVVEESWSWPNHCKAHLLRET